MTRQEGVTKATHKKRECSWDCLLGFLHRINNNDDPYLEKLEAQVKIRVCCASCIRCDAVILGENISKETLQEIPLTMWQQTLWKIIGQALSQTKDLTPITTLRDIPKATSASTLQPNTKRPYPQYFFSVSSNNPYSHKKEHKLP